LSFLTVLVGLAAEPCRITVVEKGSGWPVPLVRLQTTHNMAFYSDNAGVIAVDVPELMDRETWFEVFSDGYEVPKDGFGYRGVRLTPKSGQELRVEVTRTIIAKRLGRLTGGGLFAELAKTGGDPGPAETGILGCDSVQNAIHRGRLFWAWGDTTLARYPLGIFDMTGATTVTNPLTSFEPPLKLEFTRFADGAGKPRGIAPISGSGPTWLGGFASLPDASGTPRLVATYQKIKPPLDAYEIGLCVWNEEKAVFERSRVLWSKDDSKPKPPFPDGHPVRWTDEAGREWLLFGNPFPNLRLPARFEAWSDSSTWEPQVPQASVESAGGDRKVKPHTGSIAWNAFRKLWVTVFMEAFGKPSAFGELWYAEAPTPFGPWGPAVKVLSHANYTFYNPLLHQGFTPEGSPILLFEGTYTAEFANKPQPTPRYNYNQVLYRLDLDDPALKPAQVSAAAP
jgi:hypothetical protein